MAAKKTPASTRTRKTIAQKKTTPKTETKDHIRNLRQTPLRLRFPSQKIKDGDQRFELKPRGERGDIVKLSKEDLQSTYYQANLGLTFEALTASQAKEVVSKQAVNEQTQVHPAQAMLRNELGQEYGEDALKLEVPYEQQGKVVARVEVDERRPRSPVNIDRNPGAAPRIENVPGSQQDPELARLQAIDEAARDKSKQGPSAGLAGIKKVTIDEVQKS